MPQHEYEVLQTLDGRRLFQILKEELHLEKFAPVALGKGVDDGEEFLALKELDQGAVVDEAERRAKHHRIGEPVRRVDQKLQHGVEVVGDCLQKEGAGHHHRIGNRKQPQSPLKVELVRGGAHENRDLVRLRLSGRSIFYGNEILVAVEDVIDLCSQMIRLGEGILRQLLLARFGTRYIWLDRQGDPRIDSFLWLPELQRLEVSFEGFALILHDRRKNLVEPGDQAGFAPVVSGQLDAHPPDPLKLLRQSLEHGDIAAPEAVDRLLLVSDEEELVLRKIGHGRNAIRFESLFFRKEIEQPFLLLVVVLELVDHDVAICLFVEGPKFLVVGERLDSEAGDVREGYGRGSPLLDPVSFKESGDEFDNRGELFFIKEEDGADGELLSNVKILLLQLTDCYKSRIRHLCSDSIEITQIPDKRLQDRLLFPLLKNLQPHLGELGYLLKGFSRSSWHKILKSG